MIYTILSVFNILVAAAMIILILMQRGAGADAGASFGGGSSGTVFGARGSASFLSRATGVLAGLFFVISLSMGMMLEHTTKRAPDQSLGVMGSVVEQQAAQAASSVSPASAVPATGATIIDVPQAATPPAAAPAEGASAPAGDIPAPQPASSGTSS